MGWANYLDPTFLAIKYGLGNLPGKAGKVGTAVAGLMESMGDCVWRNIKVVRLGIAIVADVASEGSAGQTVIYLTPIIYSCAKDDKKVHQYIFNLMMAFGTDPKSDEGKALLAKINAGIDKVGADAGVPIANEDPGAQLKWENRQASIDVATGLGGEPFDAGDMEIIAAKLRAGTALSIAAGANIIANDQIEDLVALLAWGDKNFDGFNDNGFIARGIVPDWWVAWAEEFDAANERPPQQTSLIVAGSGVGILGGVLLLLSVAA